MGIFDALSGRIGYFNSITVPVYNDISLKIKTIKEYDQNDMRNLYSIFMIWTLHDFINFSNPYNKVDLRNKLKNILSLEENKFNYYFESFQHGDEQPIGLEKLWR